MSLHDAQGKVCFQGEQFPEKIHPINKKDLQRDFLKTIQPTYLLGILFLLPEVYMFPNWKTAAWGGLMLPGMITYNEYLSCYTKSLFANTFVYTEQNWYLEWRKQLTLSKIS